MKFKLNPLTGEFDYTSESANKQKLNPLTWEFNLVEGDGPFSQIFNPLNWKFNLGTRWGWGIIAEVTGNWYINLTNAVANHLMELKAYGWTEQRNLPSWYTQLEYIQADWTQYIDTGIKLNQNNTVEVKYCYHVESSTLTSGRIFWARYTSAPRKSFSIGSNTGRASAGTFVFGQFGDNNVNALNNIVIGQRDTYKLSADGFYVNDIKQGDLPTATFETPFTVKLFAFEQATSSSGTASVGCGVWRCKEFKVLNGDTLVMDLIPVKNTSNVIGMYDLVSGQFFANAGTGTFTAWPDVVPTPDNPMDIVSNNGAIKLRRQSGLPLGYKMVDWLKPNNGVTITGFKTKSTQEITAVFYRETLAAAYVYWSDTSSSGTTNTTAYITNYGNWRWDGRATAATADIQTKTTSVQSAKGIFFNGEKKGAYTGASEFVSNNDLTVSSSGNTAVRIYSLTIREGETVTLDLVPVQRLSDSAYGFYDKVSGNFYTNAEVTFVAGAVIDDPVEVYTDGTVETINAHGKNLFDLTGQVLDKYIDTSGNEQAGVYSGYKFAHTALIPVTPSTQYTLSVSNVLASAFTNHRIMGYDASGAFISQEGNLIIPSGTAVGTRKSVTFTTGAATHFLVVNYVYDPDGEQPQLEQGSTATEYEPYFDGGTATAEMLLKVGDYQDEQEILSGAITRNVGVKVLDGTESWTKGSASALNYYYGGDTNLKSNAENELICNQFDVGRRNVPAVGKICIRQSRNGFLITPNDQTIDTVAKFKQWLADQYAAGTPVIVVYPLATPTTESVAGQTMNIPAWNSLIEITQASIDNLWLYAKYLQSN